MTPGSQRLTFPIFVGWSVGDVKLIKAISVLKSENLPDSPRSPGLYTPPCGDNAFDKFRKPNRKSTDNSCHRLSKQSSILFRRCFFHNSNKTLLIGEIPDTIHEKFRRSGYNDDEVLSDMARIEGPTHLVVPRSELKKKFY